MRLVIEETAVAPQVLTGGSFLGHAQDDLQVYAPVIESLFRCRPLAVPLSHYFCWLR
jgi:hypothetical protein